jgi:ribonuclease HI
MYSIYCDGASRNSSNPRQVNRGGYGIAIYANDNLLYAEHGFIFPGDSAAPITSTYAEARAILRAVQSAHSHYFKGYRVLTDCQIAVNAIKNQRSKSAQILEIATNLKDEAANICWIERDSHIGNSIADMLANLGLYHRLTYSDNRQLDKVLSLYESWKSEKQP